jgi:hypothetical protein
LTTQQAEAERLEAAKARYREFLLRMGADCAVVFAMAKSPEEQRAAWRARSNKKNHLGKAGFGRVEINKVRRDAVINLALDFGLCARPVGQELAYKEAREAVEIWLCQMIEDRSRVKLKSLISKSPSDFVDATTEIRKNEYAGPQNRNRAERCAED